jgi:hypothetical protein
LLACLAALGVAGCGGSSGFASQANSICKTYNAKIKAVTQPTTTTQVASYLDQVVGLIQQGTAKLAALKPPSNQTSTFQHWISLLQQALSNAQQAQAAAHAGNVNQAIALAKQGDPFNTQAHTTAKTLGLSECTK